MYYDLSWDVRWKISWASENNLGLALEISLVLRLYFPVYLSSCHNLVTVLLEQLSRHFTLLGVCFLIIWPAQYIQNSAGDCSFNSIECLTSHRQMTKTYNRLFLAIRLNAWHRSSSALPRSSSGSHSDGFLGTADYTVFVSWQCNICYIVPLAAATRGQY